VHSSPTYRGSGSPALIGCFQREHEAVFASWGDYDRKQFEGVCSRFGLPYPFSSRHINLTQEHADHYGVKRMGMAGALRFHRLKLEGIHHRGIDDARNIARIVMQMVRDGWMHEWLE
jgi:3'-5' exoribonuclease 1